MTQQDGVGGKLNQDAERSLDLYKLEYQVAATRYDNIYRSLWTIFSYMALVAGGILTFGGNRFTPSFTGFLAGVPLVFWFFSSYLPLNRYGELTLDRLGKIESELNQRFNLKLGHFSSFQTNRPWYRRARTIIHVVFWPLFLVTVLGAYRFTFTGAQIVASQASPSIVRVEVPPSQPTSINLTTDDLLRLIQSLEVQVRSRSSTTTQGTPPAPPKPGKQ